MNDGLRFANPSYGVDPPYRVQLDRPPQKTYSGKLSLRLGPELHATVAVKAELEHKSINQWVADVLSREAHA